MHRVLVVSLDPAEREAAGRDAADLEESREFLALFDRGALVDVFVDVVVGGGGGHELHVMDHSCVLTPK